MPLDTGWQLLFEKRRSHDGVMVRSWTRERREPAAQLWQTEQRFEVELGGTVLEAEHHHCSPEGRWYTREQAISLFREAGFATIEVFNDFTFKPICSEHPDLFCVLGVREAGARP